MSSLSIWETFVNVFLGTILLLLSLPCALILFFFFILRISHHVLASFLRPDLIPCWKAEDALLISSPSSEHIPQNVLQIWRLEGQPLNIGEFRKHFYKLFLSTEELRGKYSNLFCHFVQWGLYCFKKAEQELDLEELIQMYEGKELREERELDYFVGKWLSTNDYGEGPQWKILVIKFKNESVLLFKIDHGLCDGYTFVHLVSMLSGVKAPYIVKNEEISIITKIKYFLMFPKLGLEHALSCLQDGQLPYPDHTPSTHKHLAIAQEWNISFTTLSLEKVKIVRRLAKCHFNTVLMSIELGALRKHCLKYSKEDLLPNNAWIPSATAWPGHPAMVKGGMCNHLSCTNTRFPFREESPLKRLNGGEEFYNYSEKVGLSFGFHWFFITLSWSLPSKLFHLFVKASVVCGVYRVPHVLTPLMLSSQNHSLMGHQVKHIYLPVQVPNFLKACQFYMVPVSNSGRLDLSVNATTKLFKDQDELDYFTKILLPEEFDILYEALISR